MRGYTTTTFKAPSLTPACSRMSACCPATNAASSSTVFQQIHAEIDSGALQWSVALEDVHMNVESRLIEIVGEVGKRLHTGRSRNDQVATDIRLYLRDEIDTLRALMTRLLDALLDLAGTHADTIMPGFTHLQTAQPVTFGHHLLAWFEMLLRDRDRLVDVRKRVNVMPLGSAALAGTTFPIDRAFTARELGFEAVSENSLDAVSDRDFAIEFCAAASLTMVHLSRWSEELVLWSSQQFGFVDLPDRFCTGSSIMPQKKNPDVPELVRGKAGRVFGHLMGLLTLMKGQPLAYNKDNQEDKEPLFDAVDTLKDCLTAMLGMLPHMDVRTDRMRAAAAQGFATATDLADYLVRKDVPFRDAHEIVGRCVAHAIARGADATGAQPRRTEALQRRHRRIGVRRADARRFGQRAQPPRWHRAGAGPRGDRARSRQALVWSACILSRLLVRGLHRSAVADRFAPIAAHGHDVRTARTVALARRSAAEAGVDAVSDVLDRFAPGVAHIEEVPLTVIAERCGTPTYVYSRAHFAAQYAALDAALQPLPHQICYAVKANSNLAVLKLFASLGAGFDIVSGGELERVVRAGGHPRNVIFSGVGKSGAEIDFALKLDIGCFNVESTAELERIETHARRLARRARISVRVNPDIDAGTHPYISTGLKTNKFGVPRDEALSIYRHASNSQWLDVVGIDCHIGSQIATPGPLLEALQQPVATGRSTRRRGYRSRTPRPRRRTRRRVSRRTRVRPGGVRDAV